MPTASPILILGTPIGAAIGTTPSMPTGARCIPILGFFLKVLKPSAYWEYPMAHLMNFLIYVAALGCFEFFLVTFIAKRKSHDQELLNDGKMGLPESCWWLLAQLIHLLIVASDRSACCDA